MTSQPRNDVVPPPSDDVTPPPMTSALCPSPHVTVASALWTTPLTPPSNDVTAWAGPLFDDVTPHLMTSEAIDPPP